MWGLVTESRLLCAVKRGGRRGTGNHSSDLGVSGEGTGGVPRMVCNCMLCEFRSPTPLLTLSIILPLPSSKALACCSVASFASHITLMESLADTAMDS